MLSVLLLILGIVFLYYGADALIRGSASYALRMGLPPIVIGLTVVGYSTGMPELIVSIQASFLGRGEIALGNVIGSNICNIGLILGISALLKPIEVKKQIVRIDAPIMIFVSLMVPLFLFDGYLSRWKGIIFLAGLIIYTVWVIVYCESHEEETEEVPKLNKNVLVDWLFIIAGLFGMWLGAKFFVSGAVMVAKLLGVSDAVIGLTVIAFGTSLPELATSVIAIIKNHRDLAVGNIIGSNIFNILAIIGVTSLLSPFHVAEITMADYAVMIAFAVVVLPLMWRGHIIRRYEGAVLFLGYLFYMFYLYDG